MHQTTAHWTYATLQIRGNSKFAISQNKHVPTTRCVQFFEVTLEVYRWRRLCLRSPEHLFKERTHKEQDHYPCLVLLLNFTFHRTHSHKLSEIPNWCYDCHLCCRFSPPIFTSLCNSSKTPVFYLATSLVNEKWVGRLCYIKENCCSCK